MSAEAKPVEELGPGDFQTLVGQRFTVVLNEGDFGLELVNVRELPAHSRRQGQPFVLLFRGPQQPVLPQRTYTLAHAELGQLVIFLVPVQGGPAGIEYEAVFN
ncbi:MAG TPA: hypothetical protein VGS57_15755 [Thermoanaerobaculia bacterium]|jgi:hypothetical protein|nr:hypothetical protein [Thermoanaerobaculia bacterium]